MLSAVCQAEAVRVLQVGDRAYFFIADSHEEKTEWISCLGKAIIMKSQLTTEDDYEDFADRDVRFTLPDTQCHTRAP